MCEKRKKKRKINLVFVVKLQCFIQHSDEDEEYQIVNALPDKRNVNVVCLSDKSSLLLWRVTYYYVIFFTIFCFPLTLRMRRCWRKYARVGWKMETRPMHGLHLFWKQRNSMFHDHVCCSSTMVYNRWGSRSNILLSQLYMPRIW